MKQILKYFLFVCIGYTLAIILSYNFSVSYNHVYQSAVWAESHAFYLSFQPFHPTPVPDLFGTSTPTVSP